MRLRVQIDHGRCLGSGTCTSLAPLHFVQDAAGRALVQLASAAPDVRGLLDGLSAAEADGVREAAMFCPPEAITVWDDETGEQLFP